MPVRKSDMISTGMDCLIVADDLTGACDAAVQFAVRGFRADVLVCRNAQASGARVIAINTQSRDLPDAEIRRAMAAAASQFPVDSGAIVFKKIDSTMRGNTGQEIAAALEAFDCDAAIVCPAFPKMHRIVEQGSLRIAGTPEFAPIEVASRLQLQSGQACAHTRHDGITALLSGDTRFVSVEANCDQDLDSIAAAAFPMGRGVLWAGSAGLAAALAPLLGGGRVGPPVPFKNGPALFCIGSDHPVTIAQQAALLAGRPSVLAATREAIRDGLTRGEHVVLPIPRGLVSAGQVRELIAGAPAAALVLSGGDTASLVCEAAGIRRIALCDEIVPGVPRGTIHGGEFAGISIVTKSGGFGDRDALIQVADFFACPKQP